MNKKLIIFVGSKRYSSLSSLNENETIDVILARPACLVSKLKFGKIYSKTNKLALYCNRYWMIGLWDSEVINYLELKNDRRNIVLERIEIELSGARSQKLIPCLIGISKSRGSWRTIQIIFFRTIYLFNLRVRRVLF